MQRAIVLSKPSNLLRNFSLERDEARSHSSASGQEFQDNIFEKNEMANSAPAGLQLRHMKLNQVRHKNLFTAVRVKCQEHILRSKHGASGGYVVQVTRWTQMLVLPG